MTPLTTLILATASFVGTHFLLSHPLRPALAGKLGELNFLGLYSVVAMATFAWMVLSAWAMEPGIPLWLAPRWFFEWLAPLLMLFASVLLVGSLFGNPALPNPGGKVQAVRPATGVFAITRHPMNWAFIIWALTHIALSGTPENLTVATGILILTFFGSVLQDRKKQRLLGDAWRGWEARTSFIPFAAIASGRIPGKAAMPSAIALIGGALLWIFATYAHNYPVGPWRWIG